MKYISTLLLLSLHLSLYANEVELTNQAGQSIQCRIEGIDGEMLKMRRSDGRYFEYPIAELDEPSQKIATHQIQRLYKPSLQVLSVKTSSRSSSSVDVYGREHTYVSKERAFSIKIQTFCPLDTPIKVEWYYVKGDGFYNKSAKNAVVSSQQELEFIAEEGTSWHGIDNNAYNGGRNIDSSSGSKRLDLVVLVRLEDGEIVRSYTTSREAEDQINALLKK